QVAALAVEGDGDRLALARPAAQLEQKVHVPGLAAVLAIGDALKADVLLQLHHLADRRVFLGRQLFGADTSGFPLEPPRLERGGTQQATDVIGAERRTIHVGGPDMAPHTPRRSSRPGTPVALLDIAVTSSAAAPETRASSPTRPWLARGDSARGS